MLKHISTPKEVQQLGTPYYQSNHEGTQVYAWKTKEGQTQTLQVGMNGLKRRV